MNLDQQPLDLMKYYKKEIEIHKDLKHPGIIQYYGYFLHYDCLVIILELCPEGNLFQFMHNSKGLETVQIQKIFLQVTLVIQYLHQNDIILRDLKPENILISSQHLDVKVCDFGWSFNSNDEEWLLAQGGTQAYMSPEALMGKMQTQETDIWSLGIFLYELYHLKEPYKASSNKEQLLMIYDHQISFDRKKIPTLAINLIKKLLRTSPND